MPEPPGGRGQKSIFAFPGFKKYVQVKGVLHEVVPPALDDFDAKHPPGFNVPADWNLPQHQANVENEAEAEEEEEADSSDTEKSSGEDSDEESVELPDEDSDEDAVEMEV